MQHLPRHLALPIRPQRKKALQKPRDNDDEEEKEDGGFFNHFLEDDEHCSKEAVKVEVEELAAVSASAPKIAGDDGHGERVLGGVTEEGG
jgi:hypothetical protein